MPNPPFVPVLVQLQVLVMGQVVVLELVRDPVPVLVPQALVQVQLLEYLLSLVHVQVLVLVL